MVNKISAETAAASITTPTLSSSTTPTKSNKPSIDIRKLALRISGVYHKLNTITHDKLVGIEKNVKWGKYKGFSISPSIHPLLIPTLKFNKYEVQKTNAQLDLKTYFDNPMFDALSHKEKEDIYYMLRLRAGVRPLIVVLIIVMGKLKDLGYQTTGTINGEIIQFPSTKFELRTVTFAPNEVNFLVNTTGRRPRVAMVENFTCCANGENKHYVLCCEDDIGSVYVLDIGGLHFGLRGSCNELIGNWEPLSSYISRLGSAVEASVEVCLVKPSEFKELMEFRHVSFDFHIATIKSVIEDLEARKSCCDYCGHILDEIFTCSACNNGFYCGRDCQKSDWKRHKLSCLKKRKPQQAAQQIEGGTGDGMGPKLEDVAT